LLRSRRVYQRPNHSLEWQRGLRCTVRLGGVARAKGRVLDASVSRSHLLYYRASIGLSLLDLLAADPFAAHDVSPGAKRVVSFLRQPINAAVTLPIESDGARILSAAGREAFTVYVPSEKGPVFMKLIEKSFGIEVTTRTWETVRKCATA